MMWRSFLQFFFNRKASSAKKRIEPESTFSNEGSRFADQLEPGSKLLKESLVHSLELSKDRKFILKRYYYETRQMTHFETYSDLELKTKDGRHAEWFDDGRLWFSGNYVAGKKEGEWKEVLGSLGDTYTKGYYRNGQKEGKWITFEDFNSLQRECHYRRGELNGSYKIYDEEGALEKDLWYVEGIMTSVIFSKTAIPETEIVEEMPSFPGCEAIRERDPEEYAKCAQKKMLNFISERITYPPNSRNLDIEGKTMTGFIISSEGNLEEIKVLRGVCDDIAEECRKLIRAMPPWHPGTQDGNPVRVYFNLPIHFKLD